VFTVHKKGYMTFK